MHIDQVHLPALELAPSIAGEERLDESPKKRNCSWVK
jgi:hypothetical protein